MRKSYNRELVLPFQHLLMKQGYVRHSISISLLPILRCNLRGLLSLPSVTGGCGSCMGTVEVQELQSGSLEALRHDSRTTLHQSIPQGVVSFAFGAEALAIKANSAS